MYSSEDGIPCLQLLLDKQQESIQLLWSRDTGVTHEGLHPVHEPVHAALEQHGRQGSGAGSRTRMGATPFGLEQQGKQLLPEVLGASVQFPEDVGELDGPE